MRANREELTGMVNRLAGATSPYLHQHADNPVDWYEWGPEALGAAHERDLPLFISIGYAACHWCHVMAHESFEDADTAAYLNEHFVAIKVDREERPDIDAVYMQATQAMTGQGGWPMSVFATPDGVPFFCGTYFPPAPAHGMPSFRQVLTSVAEAWRDRRDEIVAAGGRVAAQLSTIGAPIATGHAPGGIDDETLAGAVQTLRNEYDATYGGFGGAPKFPPAMVLEFLLRHAARAGSGPALDIAAGTLEAMARGGIYDQLAGGFARYSVDRRWAVPHFEKMLYDNALLARVYLHWWRLTGDPLAARVARETADFLIRDLRTPEGGFASSLDADTVVDGASVEGATYVWTPMQLRDDLGEADGEWAAALLGVSDAGTFEHGTSTLQMPANPDDPPRWSAIRSKLTQTRAARPQPARDDKVITSWNALAVSALAEAGAMLGEPSYAQAAIEAATYLRDNHLRDDRLLRVSRDGRPATALGVLDDYALLADAMITLVGVDTANGAAWLAAAGTLLDAVLDRFADGHGGLYDTAADAEQLVTRPRDPSDGATPSGAAAAAGALLRYAALTGSTAHREAATTLLRGAAQPAHRSPRFTGWWLAVAEAAAVGPLEVAVVGPAGDARDALARTALLSPSPGLVLAVGAAGDGPEGPAAEGIPLLDGRSGVASEPAAYVCRGFHCELPRTAVNDVRDALDVRIR